MGGSVIEHLCQLVKSNGRFAAAANHKQSMSSSFLNKILRGFMGSGVDERTLG